MASLRSSSASSLSSAEAAVILTILLIKGRSNLLGISLKYLKTLC
jgi:hypothetical protein